MNLPPPDLGSVFKLDEKQKKVLKKCELELQKIAAKLNEYRYLYFTEALHQTMLTTAPTFFALHQESLTADILQSISRLYDPAKTGKGKNANQNCTVYWLALNLPKEPTSYVCDNLFAALEAGKTERAALREWRNKVGSHLDLKHVVNAKGLPELRVSSMVELVQNTGKLLNYVRAHTDGPSYDDVDYDPPVTQGARELIALIKDGIEYRRVRPIKRA